MPSIKILMILISVAYISLADYPQWSVMPEGFSMKNDGELALYSPKQDFKLVFRDGAIKLLSWTQDEPNKNGHYSKVLWAICPQDSTLGDTFQMNAVGNLQLRSKEGAVLWSNPINQIGSKSVSKNPFLVMLDDGGQLNEYSYYNQTTNGELLWSTSDSDNQNSGASSGACFQYGDCQDNSSASA